MSFFQTILNSIYSPQFYKKEIPQKSMGASFGYYFLLVLLLTAFSVAGLFLPVSQGVQELTEKVVPELVNKYPKDLEVTLKNGQVSTNAKEPYIIALPKGTDSKIKNLLVIDTKSDFSFQEFETYNTLAVLTKDHIYYQDTEKGEIRGSDLSELEDFTLNRLVIQNFINSITPYFGLLVPFVLLLAFLGIYIAYTFGLIKVALVAVLVFLMMKIAKPTLTFQNAFKTTLFAITLGFLIEVLLSITKPVFHLEGFPLMTTFITLAVILLNYKMDK